MINEPVSPFRRMAHGTMSGLLAEALLLPTGLITTIYLTRRLGPENYGLFTLAATLVTWVGATATSLFSPTTIKFIGEADDWRPVGATVLRVHLACGLATTLLLWLLAAPIADLLNRPQLTIYLALFALEPLVLIVSRAHRNILIGRRHFRQQAIPVAVRWLARLILIVFFVEMGLSITGAILGSIGAVLVELVIYRFYAQPSLFSQPNFPARKLWNYATPLLVSALCLQVFNRIDLFALASLGGSATETGFYGAAQNLSIVPVLFAASFTPLLLSTLDHMIKDGEDAAARMVGNDAMRLALGMLPFAALAAGAANEIVMLIFGAAYAPAAPILGLLIVSKVAMIMISIGMVIVIAIDRPNCTVALAAPMLLFAIAGHAVLIPRLGAIGAAWVTTTLAGAGGLVAIAVACRMWRISPPLATLGRSVLLCTLTYLVTTLWPTPGLWVIPKLLVIMLMIPIGFSLLGEFTPTELAAARSILGQRTLAREI